MGLKNFSITSTLFGKPEEDLPSVDKSRVSVERRLSEPSSTGSSVRASPDLESVVASSRSSMSTVSPRNLRASLPSSWYTSENFFGLEARAIFSQVFPPCFLHS